MSAHLEHLTAATLERFRARRMSAAELMAIHEHLRVCDACAKQWETSMTSHSTLPLIQELIVGEHPPEDRLARFVDGGLARNESLDVESHLEGCNTCQETVRDFRDMQQHIARPPVLRWYAVAAGVAIAFVGGGALFLLRPKEVSPHVVTIAPHVPRATTVVTAAPLDPVVAQALSDGRIAPPRRLAELLEGGSLDVARGSTEEKAADALVPNREVVSTTHPRFRWHREEGARSVVRILHQSDEVGHSTELADDSWQPDFELVRGETYAWQVEIRSQGKTRVVPAPPQPPAMFIVLDETNLHELERARASEPANHLRLGVLAARAGLREEAEAELREASQQPGSDPRIVALLRSVGEWGR